MFLFVNFNSIKVQLEHEMSRYYTDFMLFQFHKGTIRTLFPRCNNPVPVVFQFHKGTIRTFCNLIGYIIVLPFQFHKGTIRTRY